MSFLEHRLVFQSENPQPPEISSNKPLEISSQTSQAPEKKTDGAQFERVPNALVLTRKVLITRPCEINLHGTSRRITNVPAIYNVQRTRGSLVYLADENGTFVGTVEMRDTQEWNSRSACRLDGYRAALYTTLDNAQATREPISIPQEIRDDAVFPILATRTVSGVTYDRVDRPLPPHDRIECTFPAWVRRECVSIGIMVNNNDLERLEDSLAFLAKRLSRLDDAQLRVSNSDEIQSILHAARRVLWLFLSGQRSLGIPDERLLDAARQDLPFVSKIFERTVADIHRMTDEGFVNFRGRLAQAVSHLLRDRLPDKKRDSRRYTLHANGAQEGRNGWAFVGEWSLP